MNGNIHILLTLLPEETLYSLASRICAINGYRNHQTFCDNYFGVNKNPRVADAVLDIKHFNLVTGADMKASFLSILFLLANPCICNPSNNT